MASRCLKPVQSLAANAGNTPVSLPKQEQIQGPENASIARFQGLCCYQSRSEKTPLFRARTAAKTRSRPGAQRTPKTRLAATMPQSGQGKAQFIARTKRISEPAKAHLGLDQVRAGFGLGLIWTEPRTPCCLLRNQEQIKDPKNAPIARFDGLRRYQSRSEKRCLHGGFQTLAAHKPATGNQSRRQSTNPPCALQRMGNARNGPNQSRFRSQGRAMFHAPRL